MKARLGSIRKIGLYYPYGVLTTPKALVYSPAGTLLATIPLTSSTSATNLYLSTTPDEVQSVSLTGPGSDPPTPAGFYTVKYTSDDVVTYVDTLVVGKDPTPDFPVSEITGPTFRLSDEEVGNTTSTVTVKILTDADLVVSTNSTSAAKFEGDTAVTTVALPEAVLSGNTDLVFRIDSTDAADNKPVDFKATRLVVNGDTDAGQFAGADATTKASYRVSGGPTRTIDLSGVPDGINSYGYALNKQMRGVSVTLNDAGTGLVVTTDIAGSDAAVEFIPQGNWDAKTGLHGTYTADAALNNVGNADKVTFAEIKLRIESDVMTTLVGDLLEVTQDAASGKLTLSNKSGTTGVDSRITLVSKDLDLASSLGIRDLTSKYGTTEDTVAAAYDADESMYKVTTDPISDEGVYYLLWYVDGVLNKVEEINGLVPLSEGLNVTVKL